MIKCHHSPLHRLFSIYLSKVLYLDNMSSSNIPPDANGIFKYVTGLASLGIRLGSWVFLRWVRSILINLATSTNIR